MTTLNVMLLSYCAGA